MAPSQVKPWSQVKGTFFTFPFQLLPQRAGLRLNSENSGDFPPRRKPCSQKGEAIKPLVASSLGQFWINTVWYFQVKVKSTPLRPRFPRALSVGLKGTVPPPHSPVTHHHPCHPPQDHRPQAQLLPSKMMIISIYQFKFLNIQSRWELEYSMSPSSSQFLLWGNSRAKDAFSGVWGLQRDRVPCLEAWYED